MVVAGKRHTQVSQQLDVVVDKEDGILAALVVFLILRQIYFCFRLWLVHCKITLQRVFVCGVGTSIYDRIFE